MAKRGSGKNGKKTVWTVLAVVSVLILIVCGVSIARQVIQIQQQRQNDRKRERGDQLVDAEKDGIPEQIGKHIGGKKFLEMRKADPCAVPDSFGGHEFLKRDLHPVQRPIVEHRQIDQRRQ